MDHGVLVEPDFNAFFEERTVVGARNPVGKNVVGVLGNQNLNANPAARRVNQGLENLTIGDEIGAGNTD